MKLDSYAPSQIPRCEAASEPPASEIHGNDGVFHCPVLRIWAPAWGMRDI